MQERFEIDSIEQLRAIADALRMRIIDTLQGQPMTVTQVGEMLGMAPAKIHYHVRELEKVGLLKLVETREKGGILEKYYQPIAKDITVSQSLFLRIEPHESLAATAAWFDQLRDSFQRVFRVAIEKKEDQPVLQLSSAVLYMTIEEERQLCQQINDLFKQYEQPRGREDEQAFVSSYVNYPRDLAMKAPQPVNEPTKNAWMGGVAQFNRADLEQALAQGQRLRIHVTGICKFARDISVELADSAVEQVQVIGKIEASAAVREVLERKRI